MQLENRLSLISGDVGPVVRQWTLSTAVGHLRGYVAGAEEEASEAQVERFVVSAEEGARRREERGKSRGDREEEQDEEDFATPRSSPERMETDEEALHPPPPPPVQAEAPPSPKKEEDVLRQELDSALPPPPSDLGPRASFPRRLLRPSSVSGPDMVVGSEPWHRAVPPEWVPVVARDSQMQERQVLGKSWEHF